MIFWVKNFFIEHPNSQGETYLSHAFFAIKMSFRFLVSSLFLLVHAVFPFLNPPKPFDFTSMLEYLLWKCKERKSKQK